MHYSTIGQCGQGARQVMWYEVIGSDHPQCIADSAFPRITTLLICRSTFLHAGLRHVLSGTPFALTHDVFDPASDIPVFAESEPVLILLCESLPLNEYLEILERLKARYPSAWVVLVADHLDPDAALRLYEAGLSGICPPAMAGNSLVKALELVVAGETFLPAVVGQALLEQSRRSMPDAQEIRVAPAAKRAGRLTDREAAILHCLTQGTSNKVIARRLGIAEVTVKVHIKSILRKVQAANRTQAAMWARQHLQMEIQHHG